MDSRKVFLMIMGVLVVGLTGCLNFDPQPDCTHYYVLRSRQDCWNGLAKQEGPVLGVGRIKVPSYLDKPRIATRSGENEVLYSETNRWAEPMDKGFGRVFSQNLTTLLRTCRISVFPWRETDSRDYEINCTVLDFVVDRDSRQVDLMVRWWVKAAKTKEIIHTEETCLKVPVNGECAACAEVVEAMSRALEQFSEAVAVELRKVMGSCIHAFEPGMPCGECGESV